MYIAVGTRGVSARARWYSVFAAAVVLMSVAAGGVTGTAVTSSPSTAENATNSSTPPHVNPDTVQADGRPERVSARLSRQLQLRLTGSAASLSDQEYELARQALADGYVSNLSQYAVVAQEVDEERLVEQFNLTREQQLSLINAVQDAESLATEYQRATQNGSDEKAREAARELLQTASEVNQTATELNETYALLANETDLSFTEAQAALEEIQRTTQRASTTLRAREFTDTRLTVATNRTRITTQNPARVTGAVTTANGTPIQDAEITLRLGGDRVTTRTNATGEFVTLYRPVLATTAASQLRVAYVPGETEPYLATEETIDVTLAEQTAPRLTIEEATPEAGFADQVSAAATVDVPTVEPPRLGGVPLVIRVGNQRLTTARTGPNGSVVLESALPAAIQAGETDLTVAIDRQDLAITPTRESTSFTVLETPTTLSVNATANENRTNLTVQGQLRTEGGQPLSDRPITITAGDQVLGTLETEKNGSYQSRLAVPPSMREDEQTLKATFNGDGTNLGSSTASQQIFQPFTQWVPGTGAIVVVIVGCLGVAGIASRSSRVQRVVRRRLPGGGKQTTTTGHGDDETAEDASAESTETATMRSLFARMWDVLAAGLPDQAVQYAYGVVRRRLTNGMTDASTETHREFLTRQRDEGNASRLRSLTDAYEQAAFAQDPISKTHAEQVLTTAEGDDDTADDHAQARAEEAGE